jgi:mannosyl-glycoprotein endo-beta-N-acetylglucosaminidase
MPILLFPLQEDYPRSSAAVAGDRKFDVYMGIDVFGRKTFGGGQWNVGISPFI